jgi:tRNA 2-selenouridine synthase
MNEDISLEKLLDKGLFSFNFIDARSPSEFQEDHIPGAVNIPLLDDEQRRLVGICYREDGPTAARLLGVRLVSPKLPEFIDKYMEVRRNNKLCVVYCWRGGLRSHASVGLVRIAGLSVVRLSGGYKTFRQHIFSFFENFGGYRFLTVYGPTGCAKTEILRKLKAEALPVVDLEAAACHKGSTFGRVDEPGFKTVTQKSFETAVWHDIYSSKSELLITEGESRKIGKVFVPKTMFDSMTNGKSVIVRSPMDFRVHFTVSNYKPELYLDEIRVSLMDIKRYLGAEKVKELNALLDKADYETFTRILLTEYYDPMYARSFPAKADYEITVSDIDEGAGKMREIYEAEKTS